MHFTIAYSFRLNPYGSCNDSRVFKKVRLVLADDAITSEGISQPVRAIVMGEIYKEIAMSVGVFYNNQSMGLPSTVHPRICHVHETDNKKNRIYTNHDKSARKPKERCTGYTNKHEGVGVC